MNARFRLIRSGDLKSALPLLQQDQPFYSPEVWKRLPVLLTSLMERGRVRGAVVEQVGTGRLRWPGLNCFARF